MRARAVLALGLICSARSASADPPSSTSGSGEIGFHSDRLELDPRLSRLSLDGNVTVAIDRYRFTGDRLELDREPRGIRMTGRGVVAFCASPNPPLTFGFRSVLAAPPTDLVLVDPTVRAFGVPIFWLPYLWFRSDSRVGLLPMKVAFRGEDGLLLGTGVHVPVAQTAALDLDAAGYVKGGADVGARLSTEHTASSVRWDYLRQGELAADLRGSTNADSGATAAWSVDALRGARALAGPSELDEVALRQDRARGVVGFSDGFVVAGAGASADSVRGEAIGATPVIGPRAYGSYGSALGTIGAVDADVGFRTLRDVGAKTVTLVTHRGEARADARAGPVLVDLEGRSIATETVDENAAGYSAVAGVAAEVSLPFVKEFGANGGPASWQHWVTPFVFGTAGASDARAPFVLPGTLPRGGFYVTAVGLRSSVGKIEGDRGAASASTRVGYLGDVGERPRPALAWQASGRARAFALHGEGVTLLDVRNTWSSLAQLRIGEADGPFISTHAEGTSGNIPMTARVFGDAGWDAPWVPWLSTPGWSVGGRVGVPWTRSIATSAGVEYDAANRILLGERGAMTYRHQCGCLAVSASGTRREGRRGVDAVVVIDLAP